MSACSAMGTTTGRLPRVGSLSGPRGACHAKRRGRGRSGPCHDAQVTHRGVDHEATVGVIITGGFDIAWAFWAASGLSSGVAAAVRIAGVVIGALIVAAAVLRHRAAGRQGRTRAAGRDRCFAPAATWPGSW
jgi:hypothetical protein